MNRTLTEPARAERVAQLRAAIDARLPRLLADRKPEALYDPARYVLAGGGKRLRPILLLLAAEAYGADVEEAMPAALAVEVFHNFTLVHDDIMDHASERRGRPAVHVRWDESTAILCGDLLMALSYELLTEARFPDLRVALDVYGRMVTRLCEGQALDTDFESRQNVWVDEYLAMIDGKTAALIEASLHLGGLLGGADATGCDALRRVGRHVGRAFQIQDDLLDLTADDARWGKQVGGDLQEGKKTYLLLRALECAEGDAYEWFARIVRDGGLAAEAVPEARRRMEALGVLDEARAAVVEHTADADIALAALPESPPSDILRWFIQRLRARVH